MVSRHQEALTRLRLPGRPQEPEEPATAGPDDSDHGWTPSEPGRGARHQAVSAPVWRVSWRAGLLLALVVSLGAVGWVVRSSASTGTPIEPRVSISRVSATPGPVAAAADPTATGPASGPAGQSTTAMASVIVHVVGAVATPGVVRLAAGARVEDAVQAAGGPMSDADLGLLNLARQVTDGEQVVVPRPGDPVPTAGAPQAAPAAGPPAIGSGAAPSGPVQSGLVNLNTATEADLDALPGIGPVLAARIVEWRTSNGVFRSVDELGEVSGIGDKVLARLRDRVSV